MAHSVTCAYGETLHGKTAFLSSVLQYCVSVDPHFRARLYTCENWEVLEPWVEAGVLGVWQLDQRQEPFDTIAQASRGFWPEDPTDPTSKLLPPERQDNFLAIGAHLFEGMATFCDFMMGGYAKGGLAARSGRGERIGPAEETICFIDGSEKGADGKPRTQVGGNARTHYNVAQRFIHGAVTNSKKLPGHVIWTTHEVVAKDDRSQKPILGPELVGTAATSSATRWFGNTIHVTRVDKRVVQTGKKEAELRSEYRLYLKPHYTEEIPNIPYKAVMRVSPLVQEQADKLIPAFILNTPNAFGELMQLRSKIDALSKSVIQKLKRRTA